MTLRTKFGLVSILAIGCAVFLLSLGSPDEAEARTRRGIQLRVSNGGKHVVSGVVAEFPAQRGIGSEFLRISSVPGGGHRRASACGCPKVRTIRVLVCIKDAKMGFQTSYPRSGDKLGSRTIRYVTAFVGSNNTGKPSAQLFIRLSDGSFVIRTMKRATESACAKEGHGWEDGGIGGGGGAAKKDDSYPFVRIRLRNTHKPKQTNRPVKKVVVKGYRGSAHVVTYTLPDAMTTMTHIPPDGMYYENLAEHDERATKVLITVIVDVDEDDDENDADDVTYEVEYDLATHDSLCFIEEVDLVVGGPLGSQITARIVPVPQVVAGIPPTVHDCTPPDPIPVPLKP